LELDLAGGNDASVNEEQILGSKIYLGRAKYFNMYNTKELIGYDLE